MNNEDPRYLSLVKFSDKCYPKKYRGKYPFSKKRRYIYFGEIPNMPGHCVVMDIKDKKFYTGYHIELFSEIIDDDDLMI